MLSELGADEAYCLNFSKDSFPPGSCRNSADTKKNCLGLSRPRCSRSLALGFLDSTPSRCWTVEATNINRIVVKVGLRSLETIEKASKHLKLVYICFFSFLSRSVSHAATSRTIVKHCMVSVLTSSHQYAIA